MSYVVMCGVGEYSDFRCWPVAVHQEASTAISMAEEFNSRVAAGETPKTPTHEAVEASGRAYGAWWTCAGKGQPIVEHAATVLSPPDDAPRVGTEYAIFFVLPVQEAF